MISPYHNISRYQPYQDSHHGSITAKHNDPPYRSNPKSRITNSQNHKIHSHTHESAQNQEDTQEISWQRSQRRAPDHAHKIAGPKLVATRIQTCAGPCSQNCRPKTRGNAHTDACRTMLTKLQAQNSWQRSSRRVCRTTLTPTRVQNSWQQSQRHVPSQAQINRVTLTCTSLHKARSTGPKNLTDMDPRGNNKVRGHMPRIRAVTASALQPTTVHPKYWG
jgi:hypothetical protein